MPFKNRSAPFALIPGIGQMTPDPRGLALVAEVTPRVWAMWERFPCHNNYKKTYLDFHIFFHLPWIPSLFFNITQGSKIPPPPATEWKTASAPCALAVGYRMLSAPGPVFCSAPLVLSARFSSLRPFCSAPDLAPCALRPPTDLGGGGVFSNPDITLQSNVA